MKIKQLALAIFAIGMNFGSVNGSSEFAITQDLLLETTTKGGGRLWEVRTTEYPIEAILLHCMDTYTTLPDCADPENSVHQAKNIFEKLGVSAHFVVDLDGSITQFVGTENVAYHAGVSSFGCSSQQWVHPRTGRSTLNFTALGIEFLSPGYAQGSTFEQTRQDGDRIWYASGVFTQPQKESGVWLISKLMADFGIPKENIWGHSDVAPLLTTDPGATFFWDYLNQNNIGVPLPPAGLEGEAMSILLVQEALREIGYVVTPLTGELDEATVRILLAFQQHFMSYKFVDSSYAQTASANPETILDAKTYGALRFVANYVASKSGTEHK